MAMTHTDPVCGMQVDERTAGAKSTYRHSSAHLLAAAVTELFPDAQCGIGPPTEDGFFYDFLVPRPFTPEDLAAIEKRMAHIVKQNRPIEKKLIPKPEALELFARKGQKIGRASCRERVEISGGAGTIKEKK